MDEKEKIEALIACADRKAGDLSLILPLLQDDSDAVRGAAAFCLAKVGDPDSVPALLAALRASTRSSPHTKRQILLAIGDIEPGALPLAVRDFPWGETELEQELAAYYQRSLNDEERRSFQSALEQQAKGDPRAKAFRARLTGLDHDDQDH